ncbi:mannan-binding lectin serine protease 2-like protein, partial [Dinothrombium tinctorium]
AKYIPFCGQTLEGPYGYFATPGYPAYYLGLNCSWTIQGEEGQIVHLTVLDADIKEAKVVEVPKKYGIGKSIKRFPCTDKLIVQEKDEKLLEICGNSLENLRKGNLRSTGNRLSVRFESTAFLPLRGVFLRYSLQGCPSLPIPKKGHLVFRDENIAVYNCCLNHVFEDTKEATKYLHCLHGIEWNATLTRCVPIVQQFAADNNVDVVTLTTTDSDVIGPSNFLEQRSENDGDKIFFSCKLF